MNRADRTPCYFRATSTGLCRRCLAVRAAPMACFYQRKDHFSGHRYFFAFPDQYEHFGFRGAAAGEGGFLSTPAKGTHGIIYIRLPDFLGGRAGAGT